MRRLAERIRYEVASTDCIFVFLYPNNSYSVEFSIRSIDMPLHHDAAILFDMSRPGPYRLECMFTVGEGESSLLAQRLVTQCSDFPSAYVWAGTIAATPVSIENTH
ncbi:MAG: hypothetical protein AB1714_02055 [Acidobacteriota bacterium]